MGASFMHKRKIELSNPDAQMEMSLVHSPADYGAGLDGGSISPRLLGPSLQNMDDNPKPNTQSPNGALSLNLEVLRQPVVTGTVVAPPMTVARPSRAIDSSQAASPRGL